MAWHKNDLPTPGGPKRSTSRVSRMKRQVARSWICFLGMAGLKDQSKPSRVFSSRKAATLTRQLSASACQTSTWRQARLEPAMGALAAFELSDGSAEPGGALAAFDSVASSSAWPAWL